MKWINVFSAVVFLCVNIASNAQSFQKEQNGLCYYGAVTSGIQQKIRLTVWDDNIIRVVITCDKDFSDRESLIITEKSEINPRWTVTENDTDIVLSAGKARACIDKRTSLIRFTDMSGTAVLSESGRSIDPAVVENENCYRIRQSFNYKEGEILYGLGSFQDADLALNGKKITLLQRNRDDVVPVIVSTGHYGLIWDNYSTSEFNDMKGCYYLWSEVADEINYFFIWGENNDSIVSAYRQLTGKAPLYPKWAYGYMQSKQKYNTQEEIVSVVKGFRDRQFPLDLIVQDWQYWPEKQWGQKTFNRKN